MSKHETSKLHPKMQEFFDRHREHSATKKREVHDALVPISHVVKAVRAHVLELQHALHQAELEAHDGKLDGKYNWMHSRIKALDRAVAAWSESGRDVAMIMSEVENGFDQDTIDMSAMMAGLLQPDEPPATQEPAEAPTDG